MAVTSSTMYLPLGSKSPFFSLPDPSGKMVSLEDFKGSKGVLIVFMCNHCPYVRHIRNEFSKIAAGYQAKGIAVIGINSNDYESYPEDSPMKMSEEIKNTGYTFPYLYDESQEIAKAYHAACTPDFFLFDEERRLVYRGQLDDSRPGNNIPVSGKDLKAAMDAVLNDKPVSQNQKPSMGCNIKWK